jgi:phosphohistidine phosphatase SixA
VRIIIQRHGVPNTGKWGKIYSKDMTQWIEVYNKSGVETDSVPSEKSQQHAKDSLVICSSLERSKHSAELLKADNFECNQIFNEAELPVINVPMLKILPHTWSMIFRVFWFVGISKNVESKKEFSERVKSACQTLEKTAEIHTSILLVGHGVMNRFLAKELMNNGWQGKKAPNGKKYWGYSYWEFSVFNK